ncbi:MAG: insulinase family protein, partial [Gammaproteobacteria bacterium]|nr:insulinase family protein [Gammaproteobacteria bacterium]
MSQPQADPAFEYVASVPVASLNVTVHEYRHRATGAQHFHIAAEDPNNVFLVGFRTVPEDSTGVAHILEHTALCGSERYPVRDPFFMMTRRSLNTFMNAFTSSDWTAYPFASQNRKDFNNLLQVYLDAAFFPKLDPLDFAQEGHRVEFADPEDPESPLVYKGVVYNEMKGAMSSPVRALWDALETRLFPTTTYHWNSGGDPEEIPTLTHEQLVAFHRQHYQPSNAIFMTYGDLPPEELQADFERLALGRFDGTGPRFEVDDERRYDAPRAEEGSYALAAEEAKGDRTHVVLGWLLDRITDPETVLTAHLLSGVLLDNSASPLRYALESSRLGSAPSPLCGLEDGIREMVFACGLEGSSPERADEVEALVLDTLREVAEQGVDPELVESMLHQLELSQREIGGDHFPYGLQLIVNALTPAVHGGSPAAALNIDPVLESLREKIRDPGFIPGLVRRWLLDNPHRVRLVFKPDTELEGRRAEAEAERLAALRAALDDEEKRAIVERARQLEARQNQTDDPGLLPRVGLEDVPPDLKIAEGASAPVAGMPADWYAQGTNGLVYQQLVLPMPSLDEGGVDQLTLFAGLMSEVGSGGRDYRATQRLQAAVTGGLNANVTVRGRVDDGSGLSSAFVVAGKALNRNHGELATLLRETLETARFDEHDRLRELVSQARLGAEQSVTDSGHALAMLAASSGFSPSAALAHRWRGLEGIRRLKALDDGLGEPERIAALEAEMTALRDAIARLPRRLLVISEADEQAAIREALETVFAGTGQGESVPFAPSFAPERVRQAWITSTQVRFCARAYPVVPPSDPDAAALMVLGGFLRNGFLHRAIREQGGAYGGGAGYDGDSATFRFFSYRDPRLAETLADFDRALDWLQSTPHEARALEEAILGVIARIDQPASPAGEA